MNKNHPLIAEQFRHDPRINEAKRLLFDAIKDHQKNLNHPLPPQTSLIQTYADTINSFNQIRGGNLYFPYIGSGFGNGPLVELLDGSVKYDMISGIGPHFWGHSLPALVDISINAALCDTIMQGHLQQNIDSLIYSKLLVEASGFDHCFLSSSGAMANENALKLAFHHNQPAGRILAFEHCFMGRSLALAQITDKASFRDGIPCQLFVDYLPFYDHHFPEESTSLTLQRLEVLLTRYPKQYAAMCFELIQGEGGFNSGSTAFFRAIMEVLKQHNIAVIVDEVQTYGRTTELFAFQYFHLSDLVDIATTGKLSQACATLFRSSFKPKQGLLSQTFTSSTTALQASYWVLKTLIEGKFFGSNGKIAFLHTLFLEHFQQLEKKFPGQITGPYGVGAMIAFTPFQGDHAKVLKFVQDLFLAGVIGFTAGQQPTRVRFLIPAGIMEKKDVDAVMAIVEKVIHQTLEG